MNAGYFRWLTPVAAFAALSAICVTGEPSACAQPPSATAIAAAQNGKVTAVNPTANTITIFNKKHGGSMTFTTTATTRIKVNKVKATLADVKVGMAASIRSTDGTTALAIHAHDKVAKGTQVVQ